MKISEIKVSDIATYLRLENGQYDIGIMDAIITAAKSYIISQTGIQERTIIGEEVGIGDGYETEFYTEHASIIGESVKVYINDVLLVENEDYVIDYASGLIAIVNIPEYGDIITADYSLGLDAYSDLTIALMVLCQDMYDNRSIYVDKTNINKVVDNILGAHSHNLL